MNKLLALTLTLAALAMPGTESRAKIPAVQVLTFPCCKCLGEGATLNISTGQSAIDLIWSVNDGPAYTTPAAPGWMTVLSKWIQPVADPKPSTNVAPGLYKYTLKFDIPKCTIPGTARLSGKFAADNSVRALLDGIPIPGASCGTGSCFKMPDGPKPLYVDNIPPGLHVLTFEVKNQGGASGLVLAGGLTRKCQDH